MLSTEQYAYSMKSDNRQIITENTAKYYAYFIYKMKANSRSEYLK